VNKGKGTFNMTTGGQSLDLSKIWLFSTSSTKDLRVIRKALEEVVVPAGRVLCEQAPSVGSSS